MPDMNDQEFLSRLWTNPHDDSAEFLAARDASADRQALWQSAQGFEGLLHRVMTAPEPAADLLQRLHALPLPARSGQLPWWRPMLPLAACLAVFLLLAWRYQPVAHDELQQEIVGHVLAEERFLESQDNVSLATVNERLGSTIGAQIDASPATAKLSVRFAKDCWIAKARAMHLIIKGEGGPVSVLMIPKAVVPRERPIDDSRFSGYVVPVRGGTLVVMGSNGREPLRKYLDLFSKSVKWKY